MMDIEVIYDCEKAKKFVLTHLTYKGTHLTHDVINHILEGIWMLTDDSDGGLVDPVKQLPLRPNFQAQLKISPEDIELVSTAELAYLQSLGLIQE